MLEKMLAYAKDAEVLGEIVGIDFANEMVMVKNDEDSYTFKASEVEILKEAFILHDLIIFDKDVLGDVHGNMYLVERHKDGDITIHHLTEDFEIKQSGTKMTVAETILEDFEEVFELEGNFYELKNALPKEPEFNLQIVKDFNGKHYTYFYALNNKQDKEIDLIKVSFIGGTSLPEEEHERRTISYDEYMEFIDTGIYIEVSPQELQNYVTGVTYGKKEEPTKSHNPFEVGEDEDEDAVVCGINCGCTSAECIELDKALDELAESFKQIGITFQESNSDAGNDAPEEESRCKKCNQGKDLCDCELWD